MRRRALTAGCLVVALTSGCVQCGDRGDRPTPEDLARQRTLSRAAQAAIDRGDWPTALGGLERLVVEVPNSPEVHQRLGRVFQALGDPARAEAAYRRALELEPEYADALTGLGEVEADRGRLAEAARHIAAAIEIDPARAEAHIAQGRVLESLGRPDEALAAYFRALGCEPSSAEALRRAAVIQLARGRNDQALARLTLALELAPGDDEARYHRGRAFLALGHELEAVEDLRTAAASLSDRPDVHYQLALALERARRPAEALASAERALRLAPHDPAARELTGRLRR
jgi:tetratricopeptide (TPR) repeat protein